MNDNKNKIRWCDYTVNPVKGVCPVHCRDLEGKEYCYAAKPNGSYKRFHRDETIRLELGTMLDIIRLPQGSRVFVGSTMELFGPWVRDEWLSEILRYCGSWPQHTFIFLTKRPQELAKYNPWPDNCWVGVSAESLEHVRQRGGYGPWATDVQARVKFVSFEPLLGPFLPDSPIPTGVNWVIIGQKTPVRKNIPREWVDEIVQAADKARIPVFEKDNLKPLLGDNLRQEWPR